METSAQILDRLLRENNLVLKLNTSKVRQTTDGAIIIEPPTMNVGFTLEYAKQLESKQAVKEVVDTALQANELPTKTTSVELAPDGTEAKTN